MKSMILENELKPLNLPSNYHKLSSSDKVKQLEFSLDYFNSEKSSKYSGIAIYSSYFIAAIAVFVSLSDQWFAGHPVRQAVSIAILTLLASGMIFLKIDVIRGQIYVCNVKIQQIREESGRLMQRKSG